jgi:hypothetical protein
MIFSNYYFIYKITHYEAIPIYLNLFFFIFLQNFCNPHITLSEFWTQNGWTLKAQLELKGFTKVSLAFINTYVKNIF